MTGRNVFAYMAVLVFVIGAVANLIAATSNVFNDMLLIFAGACFATTWIALLHWYTGAFLAIDSPSHVKTTTGDELLEDNA